MIFAFSGIVLIAIGEENKTEESDEQIVNEVQNEESRFTED